MKKIIVVLGPVCSGKNTFANTLVNHKQIDIGNIVRDLKKDANRIHDRSLDVQIIDELNSQLITSDQTHFVITGIRQMSIIDYLLNNFSIDEELEFIWLEVSQEELKRRFVNRNAEKDQNTTFEEVMHRDRTLGLAEVEQFVRTTPITKIIVNE